MNRALNNFYEYIEHHNVSTQPLGRGTMFCSLTPCPRCGIQDTCGQYCVLMDEDLATAKSTHPEHFI
jgi:hypothetical protein